MMPLRYGGLEESPENPGMGDYIPTSSYALTPAGQAGIRGLGDCGCGCGGGCGSAAVPVPSCGGMGYWMDGTGVFGTGLFNGTGVGGTGLFVDGMNTTTWGFGEYAVILFGLYAIWSVFYTTGHAVGYAASVPKRVGRAARGVKSAF